MTICGSQVQPVVEKVEFLPRLAGQRCLDPGREILTALLKTGGRLGPMGKLNELRRFVLGAFAWFFRNYRAGNPGLHG